MAATWAAATSGETSALDFLHTCCGASLMLVVSQTRPDSASGGRAAPAPDAVSRWQPDPRADEAPGGAAEPSSPSAPSAPSAPSSTPPRLLLLAESIVRGDAGVVRRCLAEVLMDDRRRAQAFLPRLLRERFAVNAPLTCVPSPGTV